MKLVRRYYGACLNSQTPKEQLLGVRHQLDSLLDELQDLKESS